MRTSHMESRAVAKEALATDGSAFLRKTYSILMNEQNHEIINWSSCGTRFSILDHERFSSEILPKYFKHNNTKSFVRQLNIHGFKKFSPKAEKGKDYYNDFFKRGQPDLLKNIERVSIKSREENMKRLTQLDDICANGVCQPGTVFTVPCGTNSVEACAISIGTFSTDDDSESSCKEMLPSSDDASAIIMAMKIHAKYKKSMQDSANSFSNPVEKEIYMMTKQLLSKMELLQNISVAAVQDSAMSNCEEIKESQQTPKATLKTTASSDQTSSMLIEAPVQKQIKFNQADQKASPVKPLPKPNSRVQLEVQQDKAEDKEELQLVSLGKRESVFSSMSEAQFDSGDEEPDTSSWFNTSYLYNVTPPETDSESQSVFKEFDLDLPDL